MFNPDNKGQLDNVLTYHVLSGAVYSNQITDGQVIPTLDNKLTVTAHVQGGRVSINEAHVIKADIKASNGVIHIIDGVLVPSKCVAVRARVAAPSPSHTGAASHRALPLSSPSAFSLRSFAYPKNDIVTTAVSVASLSTLVTALKAGGLVDALTYPHGPFTVFA